MRARTRNRQDSRTAEELEYVLGGIDRVAHARRHPAVLRAAGTRIYRMSAERMRAVAGNKQPWQSLAWGYRDMIGELRFALQFRSRTISRVKFFVAQVNPDATDDEPIPLALRHDVDDEGKPSEKSQRVTLDPRLCEIAEDELDRLPIDDGYNFTGIWSENFDVAGDCWLHGFTNRETGQEEWKIRSVLDVDVQGSTVTVKDELGQPRPVDLGTKDSPGTEEIYRLHIPHPARPHLADSALNSLMDTLEDVVLAGREIRAVSRSRIMANGVWMVPIGMTQLRNTRDDTNDAEDDPHQFMIDLQAALLAPISNEGDPGGVAPVVITGTREDIEVAKDAYVRFEREDSPTLLTKLDHALKRMGTSLDIPPEILTGMADVNHWTAWQIDNATFRNYLEPSIRLMVDSLTAAFLRPALIANGFNPEEIAKVRIWYNADQITENPNRRQDAIDARDRGAIGDDAFRTALGFNDADAPTVQEQLLMIAMKAGLDQSAAVAIIRAWTERENEADALPELPAQGAPAQIGPARPPTPPPAAQPDPTGTGGTGTPDSAPAGITAAAAPPDPGYRVDTDTGRRLMELDRAARDQILTAADAAIARAIERAGSRIRSKATRDPALTASLKPRPASEWPAAIGRTQALALGADVRFLLNQAWDDLRALFHRRVLAAVRDIADLVATRLLGLSGRPAEAAAGRIHADMAGRIDTAWANFQAALETHAERLLFGDQLTVPEEGELADFATPPYLVRNALAEVAGLPETAGGLDGGRIVTGEPMPSLGTGAPVRRELDAAGVLTLGYLWVYGVTPRERRFDPHWDLEGERFTSWADPKLEPKPRYAWIGPFFRPGDHKGCMCDYVPGYAVPDYAAQVRERLGSPSTPTQDLLDLAAADDAAGRKNTTAQAIRDEYQAVQALQARFMNGD